MDSHSRPIALDVKIEMNAKKELADRKGDARICPTVKDGLVIVLFGM